MPKGMIWSFAAATIVALALTLFVGLSWLRIFLLILTVILAGMTVWTILMYRAFSYNGKRQMSRQIIDGVAEYVKLPDGGRGLDVGCGSGALTIAVAKRNPNGKVFGIDRWGAEYASFSKKLCEDNAMVEGVSERTVFAQGDALKLDFPDEAFDAVTSNYVLKKGGTFAIHDIFSKSKYGDMQAFVRKLKDMGYEQVELIPTDNGRFMTPWEAKWMALSGSAILVGKK